MDTLDFGLKPLRAYLSDDAFREACRRAERTAFSDGETLQMRGDKTVRLCLVASGAVRLGRYQHDGSFTMISMIGTGGHFGEVGLQRKAQTHDAHAVGPTEIDVLSAAVLEDLLRQQPGFAMGLWRCNTARLNALIELYEDARTLSIPQRVAKVLYVHAGRGSVPEGVACIQRDLAALLGVTQVSIGAALKELEAANLAVPGYRCVRVKDKTRLGIWLRKTGAV
ncbi:MAG: Crp/Fnr family transcriptional regulator [Pseudomonadota bacterium]